ncbi:hypothetical protein Lal_00007224, partial [Lupinus albus]
AVVRLVKVQLLAGDADHIDAVGSAAGEQSVIDCTLIELGAQQVISNCQTRLAGTGSTGNINSIYFGDKRRQIDIHYQLTYQARETVGEIKARGALLDQSRKTFRGTLDFMRGARGAKGKEEEYAVLLSPEVRNQSIPLMLCAEDAVEGQHAASAGKVDENKLFYLMSRGLSETEAKKLVIEAAFQPILAEVPLAALQQEISDYVQGRLSHQTDEGKRLVYLDNGATTQKPLSVIRAIEQYYTTSNANPHRGAYELSVQATEIYENTREKVRDFLGAAKISEIIFTKNATESLNLIAYSYGMNFIQAGDEIVISIAEHHSNLVPWQQVAKAKGAVLKYLYVNTDGVLSEEELDSKITGKTKLVAVTHVSNVLGIINPVKRIAEKAHAVGAVVVVDGAQSIPHLPVNVRELDVDFFVFSGHKMLAPMGIGVLYGKEKLLDAMPPFLFGGDMIEYVQEQETTFAPLPAKFEAGTQNVGEPWACRRRLTT